MTLAGIQFKDEQVCDPLYFKPFTPVFVNWTVPSLNWNVSIVANRDIR